MNLLTPLNKWYCGYIYENENSQYTFSYRFDQYPDVYKCFGTDVEHILIFPYQFLLDDIDWIQESCSVSLFDL